MRDWLIIPADGPAFHEPAPPANQNLDTLQRHVGGYVEVVVLDVPALVKTLDLWVGEEAAYSGLPVNAGATALARTFAPHTLLMPEGIRGGAVLTRSGSMGETIPLTPADIEMLTKMIEQSDGG